MSQPMIRLLNLAKVTFIFLLAAAALIVFFWLFPLKIIARLADRRGHSAPCPASLSFLVDNRWRLWMMRPVLSWTGLQPGETVLELGPGPGAFTLEVARRLEPGGRLVAVDIQPEMIEQLNARLQQAGLGNVETHVAGAYDLPLADESADRVFLISVLPEIPDRPRALAELHRVLKKGGILSITSEFSDPHCPFAFELINQVEPAGFSLVGRYGNWWRYTLNFSRC